MIRTCREDVASYCSAHSEWLVVIPPVDHYSRSSDGHPCEDHYLGQFQGIWMILRFGEEWPDVHELTGRIASLPAPDSQSCTRLLGGCTANLDSVKTDHRLASPRVDVRQANLRNMTGACTGSRNKLKSLILAQIERWRHG